MKMLTQKQKAAIEELEKDGDALLEKETFDSCLAALNKYVSAQLALQEAANDMSIDGAKPAPFFNSDVVSYKVWNANLSSKISKTNSMLMDPRLAKK